MFLLPSPSWFLLIHNIVVADPGEGPGGPAPSPPPHPLFLDQTEAQRAEKSFWRLSPPLSQGLNDPPLPHPPIWRSGSATVLGPGEGCSCRSVRYHDIIMIVPSNLDRDDGMDMARLVFDRLLSPLWLPRCPGGICPITPRGPIDKMPRLKNYVNKVIKLKNENVEMRPYTAVHF